MKSFKKCCGKKVKGNKKVLQAASLYKWRNISEWHSNGLFPHSSFDQYRPTGGLREQKWNRRLWPAWFKLFCSTVLFLFVVTEKPSDIIGGRGMKPNRIPNDSSRVSLGSPRVSCSCGLRLIATTYELWVDGHGSMSTHITCTLFLRRTRETVHFSRLGLS